MSLTPSPMSSSPSSPLPPSSALAWNWSRCLFGVVCVAPAVVIVLTRTPTTGLGLAAGILPAAALAIPPRRPRRSVIGVIGVLCAVSVGIGSLLAHLHVIALVALVAFGILAALASRLGPYGGLALALVLPLVGIGLSYADPNKAWGLGLSLLLGSVWAMCVSLLWPERMAPSLAKPNFPLRAAVIYGILLGCAAALAAGIGFWLGIEHVGWACAAVLLVMRPRSKAVTGRAIGRSASVFAGALAGALLMLAQPSSIVLALAALIAISAMSATQPSRWYVAPAFTTFIVFLLLLAGDPAEASHRFWERILETLLGVAIALVFGSLIPALLRSRTRA